MTAAHELVQIWHPKTAVGGEGGSEVSRRKKAQGPKKEHHMPRSPELDGERERKCVILLFLSLSPSSSPSVFLFGLTTQWGLFCLCGEPPRSLLAVSVVSSSCTACRKKRWWGARRQRRCRPRWPAPEGEARRKKLKWPHAVESLQPSREHPADSSPGRCKCRCRWT